MYFLMCFIVVVIWLVYIIIRNHLHLKEIRMPSCNFLLGHVPDLFDTNDLLRKITNYGIECGGIFRIYVPLLKPTVLISDPDLIQIASTSTLTLDKSKDYHFLRTWLGRGLITADANFWRPNRRMLSPCFGRLSCLVNFVQIFEQNGNELMENLSDHMDETSVDVFPIMKTFTINVMCESSMGISKLNNKTFKDKYFKCIETLQEIAISRMKTPHKRLDFMFRFTSDFKRQEKALQFVEEFFDVILKEKLNDESGIGDEETDLTFLDVLLRERNKRGLTKQYIREEISTFLFGGHDTTATGIAFTLYALSRNPKIQDKVLAEQSKIFETFHNDLKVSYPELKQMKYLELVINESLRMFPPIPFIGRRVSGEFKLGDKYNLPKNHNVGFSIYGCHHNPAYFPEPEKFIPERFLDTIKPCSFLPFSNGPRICIGNKFAMLQMKSCISKVVRNFKLLPPKPDYKMVLIPEVTLVAKNGIRISLEKRSPLYE